MEKREKIRTALVDVLKGQEAMHCNRVWEAWGYETMSEDDFTLVSEDEGALDELVDAVMNVLVGEKFQVDSVDLANVDSARRVWPEGKE